MRQVSENATELLGLSPKYLFSLPCFTDVLPDSQVDVLWDNIQFLADPDAGGEDEDESPHVFLLSGWGEPGSVMQSELEGGAGGGAERDRFRRREWSCWCAAHRPRRHAYAPSPPASATSDSASASASSTSSSSASPEPRSGSASSSPPIPPLSARAASDLIILEFELKVDVFNPLYPNASNLTSEAVSAMSSPLSNGSVSAGGSTVGSTDASSSTLVSTAGGSVRVSNSGAGSSASASAGLGGRAGQPRPAPDSATASTLTLTESATDGSGSGETRPSSIDGGAGDGADGGRADVGDGEEEEWRPSAEDIIESTTNQARPLPALERIRKMRTTPAGPGGGARGRRGARGTAGGGSVGTIGMMDVFAVMAQINEQLGAAGDLVAFLRVVVGIVKDLTQFHRVLVYQFDERWNGQTVAELVDWSRTHELYRGLHFPAGDIPAQVRWRVIIARRRGVC